MEYNSFTFRVTLNRDTEDTELCVLVDPKQISYIDDWHEQEHKIHKQYFTNDRIDELKQLFIKKILESENPFDIYCIDSDSGEGVNKNDLFKLK